VSVLRGEGRVPILYGSRSFPVGTLTHRGYLARPDLTGEWPTVLVVPSEWGVTSAVKDLCRRLARHGFATVAPDVFRGRGPARSATADEALAAVGVLSRRRITADLDDFVEFVTNPSGFWSSAEKGFGVVGLGAGGRPAAGIAAGRGGVALALVAAALEGTEGEASLSATLADVVGPVLGLAGRDDPRSPVAEVHAARNAAPHAEWVIYEGVGAHFIDDSRETYDAVAHLDAIERLVAFFEKHLPRPPR
jgi:carboxymethylenebutenolidase